MVLNGVFRRVCDQEDFFDPCSYDFVNDILNHGFVDDR